MSAEAQQAKETKDRVLCKIFIERWSHYSGLNPQTTKWVNGDAHGKQLLQLPKAPTMKRDIFEKGITTEWDVTLLSLAIETVSKATKNSAGSNPPNYLNNYKLEDTLIKIIKDTRNQVSHCTKPMLSNDEFNKFWQQLDGALVKLGEQPADLEEIKKLYYNGDEKRFDLEAAQLKAQADKCFQEKNYGEAISIYNKILELESIGTDEKPILYANISASYLLLGTPEFIKKAVENAKKCEMMRPTWWEGYYHLGRAQFECEELEQAKTSLTTALALNPSNEQVQTELSNVEHELGRKVRQDDFQRALPTEMEQYEMMSSRLGISVEDVKKITKNLEKIPTIGDMVHGHYHRDGTHGVKQDYAKAATYYTKAATGGNPEGMYNLALLYARGRGVERDSKISLMWLNKAAEMPTNTMFGKLGIAEAQHSLGLRYETGEGVPKKSETGY